MHRTLVNTLPATGSVTTNTVAMLRNRFRCSLRMVQADDATLILAYTAWRLDDGCCWDALPYYLDKGTRSDVYAHASERQRMARVTMLENIGRKLASQNAYPHGQQDDHVWRHWRDATLRAYA